VNTLISEHEVYDWARTGQGRGFVFDASRPGWQSAVVNAVASFAPDVRVIRFDRKLVSKRKARITQRESDVRAVTEWLTGNMDDVFCYREQLHGRIHQDTWTYPEATCATNGFVALRINEPGQQFRKEGALAVIDRVHHLKSGELRLYPEYLSLFGLLKKTIRKATSG
jgi:hypothetical protein